MEEIIISVVIALIVLITFTIYRQKVKSRILMEWIKGQYGKVPTKKDYDFEKIGYYWSELGDFIPNDEKIDAITWNDLEMDNIFYRMNQCTSFVGEQVLYFTLHCLKKNNEKRDLIEKKISFFAANDKERESIQRLLYSLSKNDGDYYLPTFINNLDAFKLPSLWVYRLMQILLVLSAVPAIALQNPTYLISTVGVGLINVIIYAINKTRYEVNLDLLNGVIGLIKVGKQISESKKFAYESQFHDIFNHVIPFKKLSHMVGKIQRSRETSLSGNAEAIVFDYLVGATLWDFIRYDRIMRKLKGKKNEFMELYKVIGEIDMAISMASFRVSLPFYCTPTFSGENVLTMEELYHPLISEPVCNTVTLDRSCIITGSNASGKSTYIKAIAINIILAQSVHTCMAKKLILPYARIITSMAVRDDLMAGESYYIKEIKYLNRIIQNLSEDRLVICAIDEILRGTNTEERIAASVAILKYLCTKNCVAIVASHDIQLTQILSSTYSNYHFCEQIQDNDIVFDYKIRDGATNSRNAIRLLEYVGFPDEVIKNARQPLLGN